MIIRSTPWGKPDSCKEIADGIILLTTASHGGFWISSERRKEMHPALRNHDGWYEEDEECSKVVLAFPQFFSTEEHTEALYILKNFFPDCYEEWTGKKILPGESLYRDREIFLKEHKNDWLVHAATIDTENQDFVHVYASIGGERSIEKEFLVPKNEYENRFFQFVVDVEKHKEITNKLKIYPSM